MWRQCCVHVSTTVCVWARWYNYRLNCSLSHSISGSSVSIDHWSSSQPGRLISGRSGSAQIVALIETTSVIISYIQGRGTSEPWMFEESSRSEYNTDESVGWRWRVFRPRFQDPQVLFLHQDSPWRKAAVFLESQHSIFFRQRWKSISKWACEKWALMWLALGFVWFSKLSFVILSQLYITIHNTIKVGRGSFSLWINTTNPNSPSFTFFRGMWSIDFYKTKKTSNFFFTFRTLLSSRQCVFLSKLKGKVVTTVQWSSFFKKILHMMTIIAICIAIFNNIEPAQGSLPPNVAFLGPKVATTSICCRIPYIHFDVYWNVTWHHSH